MTNQTVVCDYDADRNLDGKYDEKDKELANRLSSFRMHLTYNGGQSVDPGIEPHKTLNRINRPESFYDLEALGRMMDEYYKRK